MLIAEEDEKSKNIENCRNREFQNYYKLKIKAPVEASTVKLSYE
jgi:hypothetical protein